MDNYNISFIENEYNNIINTDLNENLDIIYIIQFYLFIIFIVNFNIFINYYF